jgi:isopentenyl diphosphate isomerase/L-lactate dehydrogenase-like FMN-dependent dehydrogenase
MIGRPLVYGLGAGGAAGPARAMAILTGELRMAMGLAGCPAVTSLDSSWVTELPVPSASGVGAS